MQKYKLEYKGMGESGYFDFYKVEDVMKIIKAAKDFVTIDDEVHSALHEEDWLIIEERAGRYTEARKKILLLMKLIKE